jgi:hypothetical protein
VDDDVARAGTMVEVEAVVGARRAMAVVVQ